MSLFAGVKKHALVAGAVALRIPAVAFGLVKLWNYSTTPGVLAEPPLNWPRTATIQRSPGRAILLMFAHPQCVCSKASVGELAIIMAHAQGQVSAIVFFYHPPEEPVAWAQTDLWRTAAAIPGVRTIEDRGAAAARSFGAYTSGQTLLYDTAGHLVFNGGITASRGHSGDNAGRTAITALLRAELPGQPAPFANLPVTTPVFGCSLREE